MVRPGGLLTVLDVAVDLVARGVEGADVDLHLAALEDSTELRGRDVPARPRTSRRTRVRRRRSSGSAAPSGRRSAGSRRSSQRAAAGCLPRCLLELHSGGTGSAALRPAGVLSFCWATTAPCRLRGTGTVAFAVVKVCIRIRGAGVVPGRAIVLIQRAWRTVAVSASSGVAGALPPRVMMLAGTGEPPLSPRLLWRCRGQRRRGLTARVETQTESSWVSSQRCSRQGRGSSDRRSGSAGPLRW